MELELNLKPEQVKTREKFREETEEEVNSLTQDKPGDIVELGINLRPSLSRKAIPNRSNTSKRKTSVAI
jgi:hypothetical protein